MKIHGLDSRRGTEGIGDDRGQDLPPVSSRPDSENVLESWKEIAAYIGRNERTAMRWAKELGMPVHRSPGESRGRVYALRSEISDWKSAQSPDLGAAAVTKTDSRFRLKSIVIVGVAVALLVGIPALFVTQRKPRLPAHVRLTASAVQALDDEGRALWVYEFGRPLNLRALGESVVEKLARVVELSNGDRNLVVPTPFQLEPNAHGVALFEINCFSSRGKLLWSYIPRDTFRFGDHELRGPWHPLDLLVSRLGRPSILVTFSHFEWGNSYVVDLDPTTGRPTLRYVNTGTIHRLSELRTSRATYLLAGGFNNEYDGGSLALIDENKPFAASPQTEGTRHKCVSCGGGVPDYYFVFPRPELNQLSQPLRDYEDAVRGIFVNGDEFQISEYELFSQYPSMRTIYLFRADSGFYPITRRFSSDYDMLHRQLERSQELHHSLETCPERLNPTVIKMWTPTEGWKNLKLEPTPVAQ